MYRTPLWEQFGLAIMFTSHYTKRNNIAWFRMYQKRKSEIGYKDNRNRLWWWLQLIKGERDERVQFTSGSVVVGGLYRCSVAVVDVWIGECIRHRWVESGMKVISLLLGFACELKNNRDSSSSIFFSFLIADLSFNFRPLIFTFLKFNPHP